MDIEDIAMRYPKEVHRAQLLTFEKRRLSPVFPKAYRAQAIGLVEKMHRLMREKDATLVEVNPLILTPEGRLVAADAKVMIDDNSLYRHPELKRHADQYTPLERKAQAYGLHYVELPGERGEIAVIGNGAGLVMASLDLIYYYGGHPASFLDLGGGMGTEAMECALEISLSKPGVKGVFINIFAGITRADEIAEAIVRSKRRRKLRLPLAIRMVGTEEALARKKLEAAGLELSSSMDACVKGIIRRVRP
jgi:succinyl-CoA synthetase beta subunit